MADNLSIEALESIVIETFELTLEIHGVNRDSNFYFCGGDSLSALELMSRLSSRLDVDLDMAGVPLWSSASAIAEFLREAVSSSQSADKLQLGSARRRQALPSMPRSAAAKLSLSRQRDDMRPTGSVSQPRRRRLSKSLVLHDCETHY